MFSDKNETVICLDEVSICFVVARLFCVVSLHCCFDDQSTSVLLLIGHCWTMSLILCIPIIATIQYCH